MLQDRRIALKPFIAYKGMNSLFTGLSVGSIFIIYAPLPPSVYSLGGIVLALAMLIIARFYSRILNRQWFYRISLTVEGVMMLLVLYFLMASYTFTTALIIYAGYQLTFAFGSYLVRAETMLIPKAKALTAIDVMKQGGYLVGMLIAFLFYGALERFMGISDPQRQVYLLHFLLLSFQAGVLFLLFRAFRPLRGRPS